MAVTSPIALQPFAHPALFYQSEQHYLQSLLDFVTDAVAAAEPVLIALPQPNLALVRDALGPLAARLTMADMTTVGRNPGFILGGVLSAFADQYPNQAVRMIGEPVWPTRTDGEYAACVQHEALINKAFAGRDVTVLCPYDATRLHPETLKDARATHPELWSDQSAPQISSTFAPDAAWARYNEPLSTSSTAVTRTVRELDDLHVVRAAAAGFGRWFRLAPDRLDDLVFITNELATSSLHRTGGPCRLSFWHHDGLFTVESRDFVRIDDLLAGRRSYLRDTDDGRGLLAVNAIADLVRIHTAPGQTTVHAHLRAS
ncbi:anti-sigma factor RsbA family regulatory protein [Mycolicibacterium sp.]|uniref:anti-sigma factor RsbA family regulatory protein n=1 Tax=Mycolicibacterium sp. TaxID=2320850 RepID=UPI0037CC9ED7